MIQFHVRIGNYECCVRSQKTNEKELKNAEESSCCLHRSKKRLRQGIETEDMELYERKGCATEQHRSYFNKSTRDQRQS